MQSLPEMSKLLDPISTQFLELSNNINYEINIRQVTKPIDMPIATNKDP